MRLFQIANAGAKRPSRISSLGRKACLRGKVPRRWAASPRTERRAVFMVSKKRWNDMAIFSFLAGQFALPCQLCLSRRAERAPGTGLARASLLVRFKTEMGGHPLVPHPKWPAGAGGQLMSAGSEEWFWGRGRHLE